MLGIWFTFDRDTALLQESVAAFRAAGGKWVSIIDESAHPISSGALSELAPDFRYSTDWPRGDNLRGWPCVTGMLDAMEAACDALGAEGCVKIDSDTLVLSLDWIPMGSPHAGFVAGAVGHALGMAYWLSRNAIKSVRHAIQSRWKNMSLPVPEDAVISTESLRLFGADCRLHDWSERLAGGWTFGAIPPERYAACQVVSFGNKHPASKNGRDFIAGEMARFQHRLTAKPRT